MKRQIMVGNVPVGGDAPVSIQSMLNTKTTDVEGSLNQIRALRAAGCQIVRLAVPDMDAAKGFSEIAAESPLPLVADIHFDYRLAIAAAEGGASKIRINPGFQAHIRDCHEALKVQDDSQTGKEEEQESEGSSEEEDSFEGKKKPRKFTPIDATYILRAAMLITTKEYESNHEAMWNTISGVKSAGPQTEE